jgi:predicted negative regulator of RcsB-dependent stress response
MTRSQSSFDDPTERFTEWLSENATKVVAGVAVVAVVFGGIWFAKSNNARKDSRASIALGQAEAAASPADLQRQLTEVGQRYRGTAAGTEASLTVAQLDYDAGKYQDGLAVLDKVDAPSAMANGVKLLRAAGLEGLGKYTEAAKLYEDVASSTAAEAEKTEYEANAARAYQAANDKASALRIWKQLAEVQGLGIADEARVRVGELEAAPAR